MGRPVQLGRDATAFEHFYAEHYESILAYAMRRTETRDDAVDVVAETFLTAWRRREQSPDGAEVRLWLYGIARRVTANHARGRRRYERLGLRLRATVPVADPLSVEGAAHDRAAIAAAFARLSPGDREVLTLVAVEGLGPGEAARVLGCSTAAARVRLHRARTRFARALRSVGVEV